jgi:hypothetical protein
MAEVNVEGNTYFIPEEVWKIIMDKKWWLEQQSFWEKNWAPGRPVISMTNLFDVPTFTDGCACRECTRNHSVLDNYEDSIIHLRQKRFPGRGAQPRAVHLRSNIRSRMLTAKGNGGVSVMQNGKVVKHYGIYGDDDNDLLRIDYS